MKIEDLKNKSLTDFVQGFCPYCHCKLKIDNTLKTNIYCPSIYCDFGIFVSAQQLKDLLEKQKTNLLTK